MRRRRSEIAAELIAEGRRLYEETDVPVREIAEHMGMRRSTLNDCIVDWKWNRRRYRTAVLSPPPVAVMAAPALPAASEAASLEENDPPAPFAERLARVIDAEMQVAERTLKVLGPSSSAEAERTSRVLALVSRTVQEIVATAKGQQAANDPDDDAVPRDIDEFREVLARRIHAFIDARQRHADRGGGEPAAGHDDERA